MKRDFFNIDKELKKIELHYIFSGKSHTMDAVVRNKCEYEFLEIVKQIGCLIDVDIDIESEAYLQGGLKEWWTILVKKNPQLVNIVIGVLIGVITSHLTTDKELTELHKQELRLSIEYLKHEIKDQKEEQAEINIENAIFIINNDIKVLKHKSNFYNALNNYPKVIRIETVPLLANNNPAADPIVIDKSSFEDFIITSDDLPPEIDEKALIEIISPVLKKGNYKWKGLYNSDTIDFYMKDPVFKESVIQDKESFKNGTYIECVLEISKKVDKFGEIRKSTYSVLTVIKKYDGIATVLTKQGKNYMAQKEAKKKQLSFKF